MENKNTKLILIGVALVFVVGLVAIYISFQNRQKQLEAEKNAALLNNQSGGNNSQPSVLGTSLSLINLAIEAIRNKKKAANATDSGAVTGAEVKSYLSDTGVNSEQLNGLDLDKLSGTTWNGQETYGG